MVDNHLSARVAIVDEDTAIRDLLGDALHVEGFAVARYALSSASASTIASCIPDVVVVDVRTERHEDDWQRLRLWLADPALATTLFIICAEDCAGLDRAMGTLADGRAAMLHKPFGLDDLVTSLRRILAMPSQRAGAQAGTIQTINQPASPISGCPYEITAEAPIG